MNETNLIKDGTTATFRADVIAESSQQPVLVDFWAPSCAPCQQLTPILEKVVRSAAGKVKLVKMNIDEHPQVAGQLGVKSLPAVFAFQKGQPVDGFMGATTENQILAFIERLVGPIGDEIESLVKEASKALVEGEAMQAAKIFEEVLNLDPSNVAAIAGLISALVTLGDLHQARAILSTAPTSALNHPAIATSRAALENAELAETVGDLGELEKLIEADPKNFQARFDLAVALNANGKREEAADALLDIIRRDRNWNDDGARKQLLQFFDVWGLTDPDTLSARRRLSGVLFS